MLLLIVPLVADAALSRVVSKAGRVLSVTWGHLAHMQINKAFWVKGMQRARDIGMDGMYVILPKVVVDMPPQDVVAVCEAYLDTCRENGMICYMSFSALENAAEVDQCSGIRARLAGCVRGTQPLLCAQEAAQSTLLDAFVLRCGHHEALRGLIILEEAAKLSAAWRACSKYQRSLSALIERVHAHAPHLKIVVKGATNDAKNLGQILPLTKKYTNVLPGTSFFGYGVSPWSEGDVRKYLQVNLEDEPDGLLATIGCSHRLRARDGLCEDYTAKALDFALKQGWTVCVYGLDVDQRELAAEGVGMIKQVIEQNRPSRH